MDKAPELWTGADSLLSNEHIEAIRRRVEPGSRRYYNDMYNGKGVPTVLLRALAIPPQLDNLSPGALQAYGALCLAHFCADKAIHDPSISALVLHLVDLLVADSWTDWDDDRKKLDLSGGGDPLPHPLDKLEPESLRNVFYRAVEYAVEIGIGDLYGADTEGPYLDCAILMETIESAGVSPPSIPFELYQAKALRSRQLNHSNRAAHQVLRTLCHGLLQQ